MRRISIIVILSLLVSGVILNFEMGCENASAYTPHAPIYIDGNAEFTAVNGVSNPTAAGTEGDPYIIEGWDINASTAHGIEITNTDAYFIVRDCYVHDGGTNWYNGIRLSNVINGKIENSNITHNWVGMSLSGSSSNTISNNSIHSNDLRGMSVGSCSSNTINNNSIHSNNNDGGMYLYAVAIGNTISNNSIHSNTGNGILIEGSDGNTIFNNSIYSNTVLGIWIKQGTDRCTITNNSVYSNDDSGIGFYGGQNHTVSNNSIYSNYFHGMSLFWWAINHTIYNNNIYSNGFHGIGIRSNCNDNLIFNNDITNNTEYAIDINTSNNCKIYHNNFLYNHGSSDTYNPANVQIYDDDINYWNDSYPFGGNYWHDYNGADLNGTAAQNAPPPDGIGDTPYVIDLDSQDNYPFMEMSGWERVQNLNTGVWYINIQTAIDSANQGDTLWASNGIYYENVVVNKTLTIMGEDRETTIIDGGGSGDVVRVTADWVNITGFTVTNGGGISGDSGIELDNVQNCTVTNSNVSLNNNVGILVNHSDSNTIANNTALSNKIFGFYLYSSIDNHISANIIGLSNMYGLNLNTSSNNNTISSNNIINNTYGIYVLGSSSNLIYHNNIIDNANQAYDDSTNLWNLSYPSGGNYWDDYTGSDFYSGLNQDILGGDGFGDTPYGISGGSNAMDYYPFTGPMGSPSGDIIITSHTHGEYVSGIILIEATATYGDIIGIKFYVNGIPVFSDGSYPYQHVLDTTSLPEDGGFEVKAEAILQYNVPVNTTITLIANNHVDTGDYITVNTLEPEYQPDEDVSVFVNLISPPGFDSLDLVASYEDPSGKPLYVSEESLPYDTEYLVNLPLSSDAALGTYSVTVTAYGFVGDILIWQATNGTAFLVSGESLREELEGLNKTLSTMNDTINDIQNRIIEVQFDLDSMNLSLEDLQDAIEYLNQTLPVKIDDLASQLTGVNDSLMNTLSILEGNILADLQGMNASLFSEIQNLLSSITDELVAMNSSLADQLADLLNNMTTDNTALRTWLQTVIGAIDTNLTETRNSLESQLGDLDDHVTGFNDSLQSDMDDIISDLQQHDTFTGQNHTDIISILNTLQTGGIGEVNLDELKSMLTSLAGNVSSYNLSIAKDIEDVVEDIGDFETETSQMLEAINSTLEDLARWEDVLAELDDLNQALDEGNQELQDSLDEIPKEKKEEEGFGLAEGLLIVVILLLLINLLLMIMDRGKPKETGPKALPDEEGIDEEDFEDEGEEDWEEPEEEPEEDWEEVEYKEGVEE